MRVRVVLEISGTGGTAGAVEEVAAVERRTARVEDLGLSIAEAKLLLEAVQTRTVTIQVADWMQRHRCCTACGQSRRIKGSNPILFRTLYGEVKLRSPRVHLCPRQVGVGPATTSPLGDLITDHVAPERRSLEARWASLVPYAAAAGLLADLLPIASGTNASTVRNHTLRVAERAESELAEDRASFIGGCPAQWQESPIPEGRIVVGLDGGYVRNWQDRKSNFEVIVGRSLPEDREPRYLALVSSHDRKPKRRLYDLLQSQGLQPNQELTFLTDGGEEIRALTERISPEAQHVLDWFHITMRLTVLGQYARGVGQRDERTGAPLLTSLERIKWLLWHGNQYRALEQIGFFEDDVDGLDVDYVHLGKFARAAHEFAA